MTAATTLLPLLPMQARSLANSGWDPQMRFFSWASIADPEVEPARLKACLDQLVTRTGSLRAALRSDATGSWGQQILPSRADGDHVSLIQHDLRDGDSAPDAIVARHAGVIDNVTGRNLALIAVSEGDCLRDILILANHFFLDFYSAAWTTAEAFRIYRGDVAHNIPPVEYTRLCRWMDARARDPVILRQVLDELRPSRDARAMPAFIADRLRPVLPEKPARPMVELTLSSIAVGRFRALARQFHLNDFAMGLVLLGHIEAKTTATPGQLHLSIKESGRGLLPLNTIGLPCFLAATSELVLPVRPELELSAFAAAIAPTLAATNRLGVSVSNFALPGQPPELVAEAETRLRPAVLYNSVNINAFSKKPRPDGLHGIHRDRGYTKREDLEIRFIHAHDTIRLNLSTTRALDIAPVAIKFAELIERTLSGTDKTLLVQ